MNFNLLDFHTSQELLTWYDTITKNYFTNKDIIFFQNYGLAMGAPSSGVLSDIFLQYIESSHLAHLTKKQMIILLIFNSTHTNTQAILTGFNCIHPNLHFTAETENNNTINYLDISIPKNSTQYMNIQYTENLPLQILLFPTLPSIPLNRNMLQLDMYIIDYTHTNYIMKNII